MNSPFVFSRDTLRLVYRAGYEARELDTRIGTKATERAIASSFEHWINTEWNAETMNLESPSIEELENAQRMINMMQDAQLEEYNSVPDWLLAAKASIKNELERQYAITSRGD